MNALGTPLGRYQKIVTDAIGAIHGNFMRSWGETVIDFTRPFDLKTYDELFHEQTGVDPLHQ